VTASTPATGAAPTVGVVIVNYRTLDQTCRAVASVLDSDLPAGQREVVVVDNASEDGSADALRARFGGDATILVSPRNLGFGGGNNLAIAQLETDYVMLLNSDAHLADRRVLPHLLTAAEADREQGAPIAAWVPRILFTQRQVTVVLDVPPQFTDLEARVDGRVLGIAVFGVDLADESSFPLEVRFDAGFHPSEEVEGRCYRWTGPTGVVRVTLPSGHTEGRLVLRVLGHPEGPTPLEVRIAGRRVVATVPPLDGDLATVRRPHRIVVAFGPGDLNDVINSTGTFLVTGNHGFDRGFGRVDVGQFHRSDRVFGFCGAAALLRRDLLAQLGGFDERFFLYYEDTDLSWRLQHAGYEARYVPEAMVRHELSVSTGGQRTETFWFHVIRNRLLMLAKNARPVAVVLALGGFLLTLVRQAPTLGTPEGRDTVRLHLRILGSLVRELPRALLARRRIRGRSVLGS